MMFLFVLLVAVLFGLLFHFRSEVIVAVSGTESLVVQRLVTWCLPISTDIVALRRDFAWFMALQSDALDATSPVVERIKQRNITITRAGVQLSMMLFRREATMAQKLPCVLHLHMGWFKVRASTKTLRSALQRNIAAVAQAGADAVFVELFYRLAPEHPFPAALDDVREALDYLHRNADALGIDKQRIIVGGESAGGNLALAAALSLLQNSSSASGGSDAAKIGGDGEQDEPPKVAAVVAIIPVVDISPGWNATASYEQFVTYGFSHELNNFAVDIYCSQRNNCNTSDPLVSPLRASDDMLRRLPPVVFDTHGHDPLSDATEALAHRIESLHKHESSSSQSSSSRHVMKLRCAGCMHLTMQSSARMALPYALAINATRIVDADDD